MDNLWRIWWNVSGINFRYVPTLGFPRSHLDIYRGERSSFLAPDQSSRRRYPNRDKVSGDERAPKRSLELFWIVIPHFRVMPVDELHLSLRNRLYLIEQQRREGIERDARWEKATRVCTFAKSGRYAEWPSPILQAPVRTHLSLR